MGFGCTPAICKSPEVGVAIGNENTEYVQPLKGPDNCLHCDRLEPLVVCEEGAFYFYFYFFLYLCWRCHLRSSHCTRKRFHSLPAHVRVSEAHIHVDYMGHQRTTPVWQAGRLCTDFLWKLIFAPLYLECPLSLMRYGSRRMK